MKIKKILIPEHKYHSDFAPLAGFYDYNIKKKLVPLRLNDIQNMSMGQVPGVSSAVGNMPQGVNLQFKGFK